MRILTMLLCFLVVPLVASRLASGQVNNDIPIMSPKACEENSALVDQIPRPTSSSRVFIIFRAGKGESELINGLRLAHVRAFLTTRKNLGGENVIYARGDRFNGLGRIEFYVAGTLVLVSQAKSNHTPCMDCCGPDFLAGPRNLLRKKKKKHSL